MAEMVLAESFNWYLPSTLRGSWLLKENSLAKVAAQSKLFSLGSFLESGSAIRMRSATALRIVEASVKVPI